jgi:NADH dehydrogenase
MTSTRVVIVGGGFAGVKCAQTLRKRLRPEACDIVLFNRENHLVFHPLLPEVAGGSINADAVTVPLRQLLPTVRCRTETVTGIDFDARTLGYESHAGETRQMPYDHVVIAAGAAVDLGRVPGMVDHAFPLKTMGDAVALRAHLMQQLEKAEVADDEDQRRRYLSVVVVGGGHSGVETTGEINDLLRGSRRFYPAIGAGDISVTLVHRGRALLPEANPRLREVARVKMQAAGVDISLCSSVEVVTADGVRLTDGRMVPCGTVVCTVGSSPSPIVVGLEVACERGRIKTDPDMRVTGFDHVWAVGDCALNLNTFDQRPCPPTGQSAERQGHQVADNIARALSGRATRPLRIRPLGQFCSLGGHSAVADLLGVRVTGFPAWFLWRSVYLFKLPSWSKRVKVGFDWAWDLMFPRDLVHLRTDQTERISRARYHPGDYIFRAGDLAVNFYAIERGEVEVIAASETAAAHPLAVLGAGHLWRHLPEARAALERQPGCASGMTSTSQ